MRRTADWVGAFGLARVMKLMNEKRPGPVPSTGKHA